MWIEKDALLGVIERTCRELRVPYFSTRGNIGQLPARDAGLRFQRQIEDGLTPVVLYLGDHDPSGIEMDRDLETRLALSTNFTGEASEHPLPCTWAKLKI